jgi:SAM-dependent methyltransferase
MRALLRRIRERLRAPWFSGASQDYWTKVNVTGHRGFASAEDSLDYFHWRNAQYHDYIRLMPVRGADGKTVLDYGCGPGNDLVGFGRFSKPARLIGMDVAPTSLDEARRRLALHGIDAEFVLIREDDARLPLEDGSVDVVHSSGVLHHTPDPLRMDIGVLQTSIRLGPVFLPYLPVATVALAVIGYGALVLFLKRTRWGQAIRAVSSSPAMARTIGIDLGRVHLHAKCKLVGGDPCG